MVFIGFLLVAGIVFLVTGIAQGSLVGVILGILMLIGSTAFFVLRRRGLWKPTHFGAGASDLDGDPGT
jgi:LPXTG-motif cell wall-anchored protein